MAFHEIFCKITADLVNVIISVNQVWSAHPLKNNLKFYISHTIKYCTSKSISQWENPKWKSHLSSKLKFFVLNNLLHVAHHKQAIILGSWLHWNSLDKLKTHYESCELERKKLLYVYCREITIQNRFGECKK